MQTSPGHHIKRLSTRRSATHSSVTLYELHTTTPAGEDSPTRRSKRRKLESDVSIGVEDADQSISTTPVKSSNRKVPSSPKKSKPIPQSLAIPHPAPLKWIETYDLLKDMRSKIVAPVDTMGCAQAQIQEVAPKARRISTLVSLMLSSQTKDEVTDAAVSKLRQAVGGSITVDALLAVEESAISDAICKVGFWRRKTQYLRQTAMKLKDEFESDVPQTVDELCSLPGVGPKMAFLALQVAWNLNAGIGVDVHVHRITNRLGWHKPPTKNPEQTRLNLQSWLPTQLHMGINPMLVGFGQMVCLPIGPKCDECPLSLEGLCPSAQKKKPSKIGKNTASPLIPIEIEDVGYTRGSHQGNV